MDFRLSRAPRVLGLCNDNFPAISEYANGAQRRLIMAREAGDEGWWGTWAEIAFPGVSRLTPYITTPREVARVEKIDVCQRPVPVQNQFYEYLDFGNGRLPKTTRCSGDWHCNPLALTRNSVVTFADQTVFPCTLRVYPSNSVDSGASRRVLFQGLDANNTVIYTQDVLNNVKGVFVTINSPFVDTPMTFNQITGIQKDVTQGDIQIFQVDPVTGDETALLTMQPSELVAGYRRYYLNSLPANCCGNGPITTVTATAIVKLELIPASVDTDYLLIQNLEALIEESIAIRMSEMDNTNAQQLAAVHHINAIRLLNSEITHYLGKQSPAVNFAPFGTARLEHQGIGSMM